jgi:hypothetical protein
VINPELEDNFRWVGHVLGVSKDRGTYGRIVNAHGFARDVELITPGLRLGGRSGERNRPSRSRACRFGEVGMMSIKRRSLD